MATTEQATVAGQDAMLAPTTEANSVLVETPKAPDPEPVQSDADKQRATIDRMGNELGEARLAIKQLTEQLSQYTQPTADEPAQVTFEDDPQAFIQQTIQQTLESTLAPKLQVLESDLLQRQSTKFDQSLSETYPDWQDTVKTEDFASWVQANPARMEMYRIADKQFDVPSAVELLKRYKDDLTTAEANKQGAIGAASLVAGGGDTGGARVYAASEVSQMIQSDPEAYRRWMAGDGMKAYREGRVDSTR